jgi:integration host factor subunit beta
MVKSELVERMSEKLTDLSVKDLAFCATEMLSSMSDALAKGMRVEVRGFGSFSLHYRGKRNAHNPKTGERVITMPKHAVYFKPGKSLKDGVNAAFLATES